MKAIRLGTGISYEEGLKQQDDAVERILEEGAEECLLLLEHAPVYTIGRQRDQSSLRDPATLPARAPPQPGVAEKTRRQGKSDEERGEYEHRN